NFDRNAILSAVECDRVVDIRNTDGTLTSNLLYQMRRDTDGDWLFIAHLTENNNDFITKPQRIRIAVKGAYTPVLYNTTNGETEALSYTTENGCTVINRTIFSSDSVLLKLLPQTAPAVTLPVEVLKQICPAQVIRTKVPCKRTEPNVLLLDYAEYKWDDMTEYRPEEEILRLDNLVRAELGLPPRQGHIVQPWVFPREVPEHTLTLRFRVMSEYACDGVSLAIENAEALTILWNGETVEPKVTGWFTDESIKTVALPALKAGENELIVTLPFGRQTNTEWCYLLGEFGVRLEGFVKTVTAPADEIAFQSVTTQGMPFYGGNLVYTTAVDVPEDCTMIVRCGTYRGAVVRVEMDGRDLGHIAYEPYTITVPGVTAGKHTVVFTVNGTRYNCFGALHNANLEERWAGPGIWRTGDNKGNIGNVVIEDGVPAAVYYGADRWCDEYRVREMGMLTSPMFFFVK
ncbi:MAG: hypothetical protein IJ302_08165, partial [Clostridia bacterium]|nr:hypothetical protein [Clostridia bacterium]